MARNSRPRAGRATTTTTATPHPPRRTRFRFILAHPRSQREPLPPHPGRPIPLRAIPLHRDDNSHANNRGGCPFSSSRNGDPHPYAAYPTTAGGRPGRGFQRGRLVREEVGEGRFARDGSGYASGESSEVARVYVSGVETPVSMAGFFSTWEWERRDTGRVDVCFRRGG